jgi:hypothetical protein
MFYFLTRFQILIRNRLLIIDIKREVKYKFCAVTMLLSSKVVFQRFVTTLTHHTKSQYPTLSNAGIVPTSFVRTTTLFVLFMIKNKKLLCSITTLCLYLIP